MEQKKELIGKILRFRGKEAATHLYDACLAVCMDKEAATRLYEEMSAEGYMTRQDARDTGSATYFVGGKCPQGHIARRYTSIGSCTECNKLRAQAMRRVQSEAKEKRAKRPPKYTLQVRAYIEDHETIREYVAALNTAREIK